MIQSHPSWQIEGENVEEVTDFFILACETTVDAACSHEIRRHLLLGRKAMTNIKCVEKQKHHSAQQSGRCLAFSFGFLNFLFSPHWSLNSLSFLVFQDSQIILSISLPSPEISHLFKIV